MMKLTPLFILMLAVSLGFGTAYAESEDDGRNTRTRLANKRQKWQGKRIKNGVQNGSLTKKEAASLVKGQKRIRKAKKMAKADGEVTRGERRKLNRMQNRQSRRIYRKKHNRRTRRN